MEAAGLGRQQRSRTIAGLLSAWIGNSAHLWMWDEKALADALQHHGFRAIRRCAFGDAADPKFRDVEEESRLARCLAMECRK